MASPSGPRTNRSFRATLLRVVVVLVAIGALAGIAAGMLLFREIHRDLPPVDQLAGYKPAVASRLFAANGELVGEFFLEKRYLVPFEQIPIVVRQAFVAAEDANFYSHRGIDPQSIVRAFLNNLLGESVQGGSTITQQVVKSLLLSPERSYRRKIREMILAMRLERQFKKDDILYLYLNQIYLGSGAYGVAAAAQVYFGKDVRDLTTAEASLLAGLPQAPSRTSPLHHPKRARQRQIYVLERMEADGYITSAEREEAEKEATRLASGEKATYKQAPAYVEYVRRALEERYGNRAPYQLGLRIETALEPEMQATAERAVRGGLKALDHRRGYRGIVRKIGEDEAQPFLDEQEKAFAKAPLQAGWSVEALVLKSVTDRVTLRIGGNEAVLPAAAMSWARGWAPTRFRPGDVVLVKVEKITAGGAVEVSLDQDPDAEGSLLAMETTTGYVRAMVGGYDHRRSQFNRAIQAMRQPGSAFKPLVYAAAFDRGFTPASIVVDSPVVFDDGSNKPWMPENYEQEFKGAMRLREALVHSVNVVTVKLGMEIGLPYFLSYLPRFGLERRFPRNLSIVLGSSEVTLLELVRAYGTFATGGRLFQPIFITRITDSAGNVIEENAPSYQQTLDPETAYLVTSILKTVIQRGTGRRAAALGRPAAGKTGTTNDQMDAWFVGFTPELVAGAWVGFDEKKTLGKDETGGRAAVPIWLEFMQAATEKLPEDDFPIPPGVSFANIDPKTGLRAAPGDDEILLECFRRGSEPQQVVQRAEGPKPDDFFRGDF